MTLLRWENLSPVPATVLGWLRAEATSDPGRQEGCSRLRLWLAVSHLTAATGTGMAPRLGLTIWGCAELGDIRHTALGGVEGQQSQEFWGLSTAGPSLCHKHRVTLQDTPRCLCECSLSLPRAARPRERDGDGMGMSCPKPALHRCLTSLGTHCQGRLCPALAVPQGAGGRAWHHCSNRSKPGDKEPIQLNL